MVIFQYNLYIFGIHLWTVLYLKPCYNEPCYKEVEVYYVYLTHFSLETPKRVIGKQSKSRSDASECGIWSGSPQFANSLAIFF